MSLLVVLAWVGLTATTGKTYHLASLLAALAPGLLPRALVGKLGWPVGVVGGVIGFAIAMAGWGVIVALGEEPTVTLFGGQPGGVFGEVLFGAIAGSLIAFASHVRYEHWVRSDARRVAEKRRTPASVSAVEDEHPNRR